MEKKVLALQIGTIEHQTEKAIKLSGRWFPKAAIQETHKSEQGDTVLVFKPWFVSKNQWMVKDSIGEARTKGVRLENGTLIFQGHRNKLASASSNQEQVKKFTDEELDEIFDSLVAGGMEEKEAAKQVRRMVRNG